MKTNKIQINLRIIVVTFMTTVILCTFAGIRSAKEYDQIFDQVQNFYDKSEYDKALDIISDISTAELAEADDTTKVLYNNLKGKIYLCKQENDSAKRYLSEAISLFEKLKFKYPSYIDLLVYRAYASDALNEREEAARWYRKALIKGAILEHNPDIDNNCYLNLGNIYNESGDYRLAKEYYDKIAWKDSLQRVEIHPLFYSFMSDKYISYSKEGDLEQAKSINDTILNYCKAKYGESSDYYLVSLESERSIQNSWQNFELAEIANKEILRIGKQYNLRSSFVAKAYCGLIDNLCCQDSLYSAIALVPEAIDYIKDYESEKCSVFSPYYSIGTCAVRLGEYDTGILALEKFLSNYPKWLEWGVPYAIHYVTWAYANVGRNADVVGVLAPLLEQSTSLPDNYQSIRPHLHRTLGCSYYFLGNRKQSIENLNAAIKLLPESMSDDSLINKILTEYGER